MDATDEEVIAAAKLAHCDEFAEKLSDGWNTMIGENGCELSGGERQRSAIAKALYHQPSVIFADEPTASLDTNRAFEVVKLLARETKEQKKATIMVTHDERMLEFCDKVYVIVDGVLSERTSTQLGDIRTVDLDFGIAQRW